MNGLFDGMPAMEPSAMVGFSRNILQRESEKRDDDTLARALANPASRLQLYAGQKALVRKDDRPGILFDAREAEAFAPDYARAILLGAEEGVPRLAVPVTAAEEQIAEPYRLYDMRSLLYSSAVGDADAGASAQATSLLHWHAMNRFCGRCGQPTRSTNGGYRIDCAACGAQYFPRTDPVAIMLGVDIFRDRVLLGRGPHFPPGWYSTLAGFIEPGETIEDAVRRETEEESGIRIGRVRYHASQPWPFPHSLMIGVHCEALCEEIRRDEAELEDCRWFTRDEVRLMVEDRHPDGCKCPPSKAIAHALIRAWVDVPAF